jgi:histidine triad (HIT) family protein
MNDNSCVFCKIVRKQAPASVIYEDESVMAFLDIRPLNMGHTLVIPKEHCETIYEIPDELIGRIHKIVKRTALAIKRATEADGITVIQQNERAAGQEIFHLHVHVVPRYEGQKLPRFEEIQEVNREKLNQAAANIRQYLK